MIGTLVVARYRNGTLIKGTSVDVSPEKPVCHVSTADGQRHEVKLGDLKALFFVKSLEGNPRHDEGQQAQAGDRRSVGGVAIQVVFQDRETLTGFTNRVPPRGQFFFVVPVDAGSNNLRVLVNNEAVRSLVRHLPTAS